MIIDFHAHIYPQKIADKATDSISHFYGDSPMSGNGTAEGLIASGSAAGVSKYIVHSTATRPEQVCSINDFIIRQTQEHSCFVGFGTMHPDFAQSGEELERVKNAGLRGIKLHPDFQKFQVDCEQMDKAYGEMSDLGLILLMHAGDYRYDFSGPARIAHLLQKHPKLKVVAAHFGGYTQWEDSYRDLAGKPVWFDTSSTMWKIDPALARRIFDKHGKERFLFGSDFPMWNHADELKRLETMHFSPDEWDAVLYKNALALLEE